MVDLSDVSTSGFAFSDTVGLLVLYAEQEAGEGVSAAHVPLQL